MDKNAAKMVKDTEMMREILEHFQKFAKMNLEKRNVSKFRIFAKPKATEEIVNEILKFEY